MRVALVFGAVVALFSSLSLGHATPTVSEATGAAEAKGRSLWLSDSGTLRDRSGHHYNAHPDSYELEDTEGDADTLREAQADAARGGKTLLDLAKLRVEVASSLFREGGFAADFQSRLTANQARQLRAYAVQLVSQELTSLASESDSGRELTDHGLAIAVRKISASVEKPLTTFYLKLRHRAEFAEYEKGLPRGHMASNVHAWNARSASDPLSGADGVVPGPEDGSAAAAALASDPIGRGSAADSAAGAKKSAGGGFNNDPMLVSGHLAKVAAALRTDPMFGVGAVRVHAQHAAHAAVAYASAVKEASRRRRAALGLRSRAMLAAEKGGSSAAPFAAPDLAKSYARAVRSWRKGGRAVRRLRKRFVRMYNRFVKSVRRNKGRSRAYRDALVHMTTGISAALGVQPKFAKF